MKPTVLVHGVPLPEHLVLLEHDRVPVLRVHQPPLALVRHQVIVRVGGGELGRFLPGAQDLDTAERSDRHGYQD